VREAQGHRREWSTVGPCQLFWCLTLKTLCFPIKRELRPSRHPPFDLGLWLWACARMPSAQGRLETASPRSSSRSRPAAAPWVSTPHLQGEGPRSGADDSLQARSLPAKGGAPTATPRLTSALLAFHQWGTALTGTPLSPRGHCMTKDYEDRCTEASGQRTHESGWTSGRHSGQRGGLVPAGPVHGVVFVLVAPSHARKARIGERRLSEGDAIFARAGPWPHSRGLTHAF
jgi:hypothetical protein